MDVKQAAVQGEPMDREYLSSVTDGDAEFEEELAASYLAASEGVMQELLRAVSDGDANAVRDAAHNLKGSSRAIGANDMGAVAEVIEHRGRDGNLQDADDLLADIEERYNTLIAYIRSAWPSAG